MLKVKDIIAHLQTLDQELPIVFASDDEGNSYSLGYYTPSAQDPKDLELDHFSSKELKGIKKVCVIN